MRSTMPQSQKKLKMSKELFGLAVVTVAVAVYTPTYLLYHTVRFGGLAVYDHDIDSDVGPHIAFRMRIKNLKKAYEKPTKPSPSDVPESGKRRTVGELIEEDKKNGVIW